MATRKTRVVLKRGRLKDVVWHDLSEQNASGRAEALVSLHNDAPIEQDEHGWVVDASDFYGRK